MVVGTELGTAMDMVVLLGILGKVDKGTVGKAVHSLHYNQIVNMIPYNWNPRIPLLMINILEPRIESCKEPH